jgi:hypothetical protein
MNKRFWPSLCVFTVIFGGTLELLSLSSIGRAPARPPIPLPGYEYVSATRDGQADQSIFYFDFFGFGQRIKDADALVAGSSHAEFGIRASAIANRSFNMGLGGGESIDFAILLFERYQPHPALLVLDPFSTDKGLSTEASRVLRLTRFEAYQRVLGIWAGFARDWILQGLLPRLTFAQWKVKYEAPLGSTVIRDWNTADVTSFYTEHGEVFTGVTGHMVIDGPAMINYEPSSKDAVSLQGRAATTLVTTIPYPSYSESSARHFAQAINGKFVSIAPLGLTFFDFHHLDAKGRDIATKRLIEAAP